MLINIYSLTFIIIIFLTNYLLYNEEVYVSISLLIFLLICFNFLEIYLINSFINPLTMDSQKEKELLYINEYLELKINFRFLKNLKFFLNKYLSNIFYKIYYKIQKKGKLFELIFINKLEFKNQLLEFFLFELVKKYYYYYIFFNYKYLYKFYQKNIILNLIHVIGQFNNDLLDDIDEIEYNNIFYFLFLVENYYNINLDEILLLEKEYFVLNFINKQKNIELIQLENNNEDDIDLNDELIDQINIKAKLVSNLYFLNQLYDLNVFNNSTLIVELDEDFLNNLLLEDYNKKNEFLEVYVNFNSLIYNLLNDEIELKYFYLIDHFNMDLYKIEK